MNKIEDGSDYNECVPCPCCECLTLEDPHYGSYVVCPICYWEDDGAQLERPTLAGGANSISLNNARKNFKIYKAMERDFISNCRSPLPNVIPKGKQLSEFLRRNTRKGRGVPCPCCGFLTLEQSERFMFTVCPVCSWEDNPNLVNICYDNQGNELEISLEDARKNFAVCGAKCEKAKRYCRPSFSDEYPDAIQEPDPLYPCPCCECLTFLNLKYGSHDICPVCFWEDDLQQKENPEIDQGANRVSLRVAKENFRRYKAFEKESVPLCRLPRPYEIPKGKTLEDYKRRNPIKEKGYSCPCCSYLTLSSSGPNTKEICPVCLWMDTRREIDPDARNYDNLTTLSMAKQVFSKYKAKNVYDMINVRSPYPEEIPS